MSPPESGLEPPRDPGGLPPSPPGPRPVAPYLPEPRRLRSWAVWGGAFFLFFLLDVVFVQRLTTLDLELELWFHAAVRTDTLAFIGSRLAAPADTIAAVVLTAVGLTFCILLGRWRNGAALLVGVGGGSGVVHLVKDWVARPRPVPGFDGSLSFPSGHAEKGVALYLLFFLLVYDAYLRRTRMTHLPPVGTRRGRDLVVAGWALGLLAGLGRFLEGVHWMTDILAGWAFGGAWVGAILMGFRWWEQQVSQPLRTDARRPAS